MTAEALARQIADDLFVNGMGEEAERLVLTRSDARNLGGWSKQAVIDRVLRVLPSPGATDATVARLEQIVELSRKHDTHATNMIRDLAERALADER